VTVQELDPTLGTVSTNYTYDILNHLIQVSMPRGTNTQTRTFNYNVGTTVGIDLLSATNPENGTITYTYYSDHTLHTKGSLTYSYDSYKRLTQIMSGSTVLRTFMYDSNTIDTTFSGSYTQGRLVAVQHTAFTSAGIHGRHRRQQRFGSQLDAVHRDVRLFSTRSSIEEAPAGKRDYALLHQYQHPA